MTSAEKRAWIEHSSLLTILALNISSKPSFQLDGFNFDELQVHLF